MLRKFERRLKNIEQSFHFDHSGYAPKSEAWQKYWDREIEKQLAGEPAERVPLAAMQSWFERCDE